MDLNIIVIAGRLAARPENREFENGTRMARLLIVTHQEEPTKRVDVIPVTVWDPSPAVLELQAGARVHAAGRIQRRFWGSETSGRRSRIEIVASHVETLDHEEVVV